MAKTPNFSALFAVQTIVGFAIVNLNLFDCLTSGPIGQI